MDTKIRQHQLKILDRFCRVSKKFAFSGGTALELFYLNHRFSRDLDFFSPEYDLKEIENLVSKFSEAISKSIKLENEFFTSNRARVRFYTVAIKGADAPLKIDFIEDVLFDKPDIRKINNVPVYDVENIYFQKIVAITGTRLRDDSTGRQEITGRREARDVVDVYFLSKKIKPLHLFLKGLPKVQQRGMVRWYRTFSRQEFKLEFLNMDIYGRNLTAPQIIIYLEDEIKRFITEVIK
jgi:predicted nucleotidyltransferase component of viral defense system